ETLADIERAIIFIRGRKSQLEEAYFKETDEGEKEELLKEIEKCKDKLLKYKAIYEQQRRAAKPLFPNIGKVVAKEMASLGGITEQMTTLTLTSTNQPEIIERASTSEATAQPKPVETNTTKNQTKPATTSGSDGKAKGKCIVLNCGNDSEQGRPKCRSCEERDLGGPCSTTNCQNKRVKGEPKCVKCSKRS